MTPINLTAINRFYSFINYCYEKDKLILFSYYGYWKLR